MTGRGSGVQAGKGQKGGGQGGKTWLLDNRDSVSAENWQNAIWTKETKKDTGKRLPKATLVYACTVCRTQMPNPKAFKQPLESKHPDSTSPELAARCYIRCSGIKLFIGESVTPSTLL